MALVGKERPEVRISGVRLDQSELWDVRSRKLSCSQFPERPLG